MRPWVLTLLLAACGNAERPEAPHEAQRIVSLLPSFTEMIVGLGAGDRIVACTVDCRPGREVPRLHWQGAAAVEAILRTAPDLVVKQAPRATEDTLHGALERAGVPVLALKSESVQDVRVAMLAIGGVLGKRAVAMRKVEEFNTALVKARAGAVGKKPPTVLFVFGRDRGSVANITGAGPGSFLDELIRYAGGRNALEDVDAPYPSIKLEDVVRCAPQVIIDNLPPEEDHLEAWRDLAVVPAVRDGRVYAVRDRDLLIPGPRLPEAVRRLVEMIHGRP